VRRFTLLVVLALGLLGALALPAHAAPSRPAEGPDEVECKNPTDWSSVGGAFKGIGDAIGLGTNGSRKIKLDTTAPVWYRQEAKSEAEKEDNCNLAEHAWQPDCETMKKWETDDDPKTKGYDDGVVPDSCVGKYPGSAYNITYDADFFSFDRKLWGVSTGFVFNIGKTMVQVGMWGIKNAFSTRLTDYTPWVEPLAKSYDTDIVGPFGIKEFSWMVLIGFWGFTMLRGKIGHGMGELILSGLLLGCASAALTNLPGYMNATSDRMDEVTVALLNTATLEGEKAPVEVTEGGKGAQNIPPAIDKLRAKLFEQFVEEPYTYINWGGPEKLSQYCQERINYIKAAGLMNDGGWAWRFLGGDKGQCADAVRFNKEPSTARFVGALLTTVVAAIVMWLLLLMSFVLIMIKFGLAWWFACWPLFWHLSVLPGTMRRSFWSPLVIGAQLVLAHCGTTLVLVLWLKSTTAWVTFSGDTAKGSLLERWSMVLAGSGVAVIVFKGMRSWTQKAAERMGDSLTRISPTASNWAGGMGGGVNLNGADRAFAMAAVAPYNTARVRMAERRNARRSLKNLETMERRREAPIHEYKTNTSPSGGGGGGGSGGGGGGGGSGSSGPATGGAGAKNIGRIRARLTAGLAKNRKAARDARSNAQARVTARRASGKPPRNRFTAAVGKVRDRLEPGASAVAARTWSGTKNTPGTAWTITRGAAVRTFTGGHGPQNVIQGDRTTNGGTYTKLRAPRVSDWRNPAYAVAVRWRARRAPAAHRRADRKAERWWG
jgi:uncharacterized membrane protein YgcG